jgi:membrane-bound lytic murein transglycosylase B
VNLMREGRIDSPAIPVGSLAVLSLLIISSLLAPVCTRADTTPISSADQRNFGSWLNAFRERARQDGISEKVLESQLGGLEPNPEIIEEDDEQAEFTTPFPEYRNYFVTDSMVEKGKELKEKHRDLLFQLESKYGPPAEIILAIWGVESRYGSDTSEYPVITALASLAYRQNERGNYFEDELLTLLRLVDQGVIEEDRLAGSWAGALGQPQFMPSSFKHYAVDQDGDGRRNIWTSTPDVLGSIAHYLAENGWQSGHSWVKTNESGPSMEGDGRVITPDSSPVSYRVYPNFDILMRYNPSRHYSLSVGLLANKIGGL